MPTGGIGSFFPYPDAETLQTATEQPIGSWPPDEWVLYNSGRAALRAIIEWHKQTHPGGCLWVPSYYCWDVTRYASSVIPVRTYSCRPTEHHLPDNLDADDLLLVVSYFGAEPPLESVPPEQVLLDSSHDPTAGWVSHYPTAWVFGSLRKTLPLPEGGYAYTQGEREVQLGGRVPTDASRLEAQRGASAMADKLRWIAGDVSTEKAVWYEALQDHEAAFGALVPASLQPETMAMLRSLPVTRWRNNRLRNLDHLLGAMDGVLNATTLPSTYGLPVILPSKEAADAIRLALVNQAIYPARIWPQPADGPVQDVDLADRMLLLATDFRYSEADMEDVALAMGGVLNRGDQR